MVEQVTPGLTAAAHAIREQYVTVMNSAVSICMDVVKQDTRLQRNAKDRLLRTMAAKLAIAVDTLRNMP